MKDADGSPGTALTEAALLAQAAFEGVAPKPGAPKPDPILVASNVPIDTEGSIDRMPGVRGKGFRDHWPHLGQALTDLAGAIPDGRTATTYLSLIPNLAHFSNWLIEHRYWRDAALPLAAVGRWQAAAAEVMAALDQAKEDGRL